MKKNVLAVLMNLVGSKNVRVELSKIYVYDKSADAFVFFKTRIALDTYEYDNHDGWRELESDLAQYGY